MKKVISIVLSLILIVSMAPNAAAIDTFADTAEYLINTTENPSVASVGGEWTVIGLARSGADVQGGYFAKYYTNALSYIKAKDGVLHTRKYTEYARVVLALTAIGENPEDVAGYNLVAPLLDYEKTMSQGINGAVWALIALDSKNYGTAQIREQYILKILECEKENGGWSMAEGEKNADADITAMALTALAPYKDRQEVNFAIERALSVLSFLQNDNGGYLLYGVETSESAAQVLCAISSLGISYKDERFIKNGKTLIDNILSFKQADGSFAHTDESNLMATEQCYYALVSAKRLEENKTPIFDMSDILKTDDAEAALPGKNPDINVPEIKFPAKTFADIIGHKNEAPIEKLAERGIISGMGDNAFLPDNTMTRAEFATITVRALGLPVKNTPAFSDVDASAWYAKYVNTAYSYGIISGISETEFDPDGTITVEQASSMLCRAAKFCGKENNLDNASQDSILAQFSDYMSVSNWAKSSVAFCVENNILHKSQTEINPLSAVKRCQIADMLYNMLKGARLI